MRTFAIILLLASLFAASCGEPPMPPSDEEMIRHFATHEAAFRKVYEIMAESSEGSFHYPPLSPEDRPDFPQKKSLPTMRKALWDPGPPAVPVST